MRLNHQHSEEEELIALWELTGDIDHKYDCESCIHIKVDGSHEPCTKCSVVFSYASDRSFWELSIPYAKKELGL